jgi:hypothetical protein
MNRKEGILVISNEILCLERYMGGRVLKVMTLSFISK